MTGPTIRIIVTEEKDVPIAKCPFCGYAAYLELIKTIKDEYQVRCTKCNTYGPEAISQKKAVERWNERR